MFPFYGDFKLFLLFSRLIGQSLCSWIVESSHLHVHILEKLQSLTVLILICSCESVCSVSHNYVMLCVSVYHNYAVLCVSVYHNYAVLCVSVCHNYVILCVYRDYAMLCVGG